MTFAFRVAAAAALLLFARVTAAQQAMGTLVFDVKSFTSEVPLKPKVQRQLETGGIDWGVKDGQVVVTLVNKRFIDFDISHMTRYGKSESLQLPAGEYRLTGIGIEMHTSFSVDKVLAKGAYFNQDVVTFRIEEGKTTTLTIRPIIQKDMTFLIKWYLPALMTSVTTESGSTEEKAINLRGPTSIAWPAYNGPLKFKPN